MRFINYVFIARESWFGKKEAKGLSNLNRFDK